MALTGTPVDLYQRKYLDAITHELQQKGSVLRGIVNNVAGEGSSLSIQRIGASDNASEVSSRWAPIEPEAATFERRLITPKTISQEMFVDHLDLIRGADPTSDIVKAITMSLGRQLDKIIYSAMSGSAVRELDGSSGTVAFDSNNTIAVNDTTFATAAVTVNSLHEGKIKLALKKLAEAYVDMNDEIFVIGTAAQFLFLETRLESLGQLRRDMLGNTPLAMPGVVNKLTGYQGLTFIQYQPLADAENLTSSNEYVYIFPRSAITLGVWGD